MKYLKIGHVLGTAYAAFMLNFITFGAHTRVLAWFFPLT